MTGENNSLHLSAGFHQQAATQIAIICSESFTAVGGPQLRDSWAQIPPDIHIVRSVNGIYVRAVVARVIAGGAVQRKIFNVIYDVNENYVDFNVCFTTTEITHNDEEIPDLFPAQQQQQQQQI